MRGDVKIKYFDIELDWVGKFRNVNQASFWSTDTDEGRLAMYLQAHNGGSITPRYRKILNKLVDNGSVALHTHTTLKNVRWGEEKQTWSTVVTAPRVDMPPLDYIVFAAGVDSDIKTLPYLQKIIHDYSIDYVGGFPCLNDDLMWNDDVPLFVNGRLAGMRLGPGAPNLIGVRTGAERIAWNVEDVLQKAGRGLGDSGTINPKQERDDKLAEYAAGRRNRYDSLVDVESQ